MSSSGYRCSKCLTRIAKRHHSGTIHAIPPAVLMWLPSGMIRLKCKCGAVQTINPRR